MFIFSKLLSAVTQPMFWLGLWWALALLMLTRWRRLALIMLWSGLAMLGLLGFSVIPDALLRSLETRYPIPAANAIEGHIGVIVLGYREVPLGEAAERMNLSVVLMRHNPSYKLVFSGGNSRPQTSHITESERAKVFYEQRGLDMTRVILEDGSRNTRENAQRVAQLLGDRCQERWFLVTSAWHMPRSMAEFEAVGCKVTAYPVDFRSQHPTAWGEYSLVNSLLRWQVALHEWLGLLVYGITR